MNRPFAQVDVFTDDARTPATRWRWCSTATGWHRGDAALRELDEPVGDDVRAPADGRGRRLPRAHLHAGGRAAVRRPPDARHLPRLARRRATTTGDVIVQECEAGLVRCAARRPAWRSRRRRSSARAPVDEKLVGEIAGVLGISRAEILDAQWADNGPGWVAVLLESAEAVLAVRPRYGRPRHRRRRPAPAGASEALEVRAFFPKDGTPVEDPVTGSLNASLAEWLLGTGRLPAPYIARQGTALGRAGRVHVSQDAAGTIWVGGGTVTCVAGEVEL